MVWHHSLLLMNSFKKTEAAVFSCRLCFLRPLPFISLLIQYTCWKSFCPLSNTQAVKVYTIYDLKNTFITALLCRTIDEHGPTFNISYKIAVDI